MDYTAVTKAFARLVRRGRGRGAHRRAACLRVERQSRMAWCSRRQGGAVEARALINCAGLQSDRVARLCGVEPGVQIVPFRGEYYELVPERQHLVRNLIYPVPDPRFPFLGVHFTRMIHGGVEAGPNAVLAFRREGYTRTSFSPKDCPRPVRRSLASGGWRRSTGGWAFGEMYRSFSKRAFVAALQRTDPGASRRGRTPERRRRPGAGARPAGRPARRFPHRGGRADDPRAERAVACRHRLDQHRAVDRRDGRASSFGAGNELE